MPEIFVVIFRNFFDAGVLVELCWFKVIFTICEEETIFFYLFIDLFNCDGILELRIFLTDFFLVFII